jgi:signal transduction histidine kinase
MGFGLAAVAIAGAALLERVRFGATELEALQRVEREVRGAIDSRAGNLRALALRLAALPEIVGAAERPHERTDAAFAAIELASGPMAPADLAVTAYAADGTAVAWRGRPSTLPAERLSGEGALFAAPGPMGLRLVSVQPVVSLEGPSRRRVGLVATERVLSQFEGVSAAPDRGFLVDSSLAPVSVQTRAVGADERPGPDTFVVRGEAGDLLLTATVSLPDIEAARARLRQQGYGTAAVCVALAMVALVMLVVESRRGSLAARTLAALGIIAAARVWLWHWLPDGWRGTQRLLDLDGVPPVMRALLRSPADIFVNALAALAVVLLLFGAVEHWRLARRGRRRRPLASPRAATVFLAGQLAAGLAAGLAVVLFEYLLRKGVQPSGFSVLDLVVLPWELPRAALLAGIVLLHAAVVWLAVTAFRVALTGWRVESAGPLVAAVTLGAWLLPVVVLTLLDARRVLPAAAVLLVVVLSAATAWSLRRGLGWFRRASQGTRLVALGAALVAPSAALEPSLSSVVEGAREKAVATSYAQQALEHPEQLQAILNESLRQIDGMPALAELVASLPETPSALATEAAFSVWQQTSLARQRLTSGVELYGPTGKLVSRFALNFPEYASLNQHWFNQACAWGEVFGEAAPFGAEERRMLHAERAVCGPDGRPRGTIVVHVMLDYSALSFLSSQSPYFEFFRAPQASPEQEPLPARDVSLVVYGWGRTPIYTSSGRAWPLDEQIFRRLYQSREPFWSQVALGNHVDRVFFANDRYGIYAVGYTPPGWFDHLVHVAELSTLAALLFAGLTAGASVLGRLARPAPGPMPRLIAEVRGSFSRKLFLAFVAASSVPVLVLALTIRAYVASRLRAEVEAEAARTAAVAQRVIQETLATQRRDELSPLALSDDVMVWISRVIDQDVNIFVGTQLAATSERDLFASGLLPARVPDSVYRAIVLQRLPSYVGEDQIADFSYLMAATPIRAGDVDAILTVPLASQQREIEREIEDLDRGVQLGAVVFLLLGAAVGYWLAERIAEPVERLTRASRRIASGELSARVFVRTADELQRLVESFNSMAVELERQRSQLEHTNRLEAWAEMARQVAHDIKNPLTPIQLSAEHLRRVHHDRGEPLSPVLERCVDTILSQVRLLRRISAEFSSFATTPTLRPEPCDPAEIVTEVAHHYQTGLPGHVRFRVAVEPGLPELVIDRMLIARAITNLIENALQAMPRGGEVVLSAGVQDGAVTVTVSDTGVGMDASALDRAFDPSFSTKTTGTGLGLPIARRNVELHGGSVAVTSVPGQGTTVLIRLPIGVGEPPTGTA